MNKKGLTLVEWLIVVGVIGILASIMIPCFLKARDNASAKHRFEVGQIVKSKLGGQEGQILDRYIWAGEATYQVRFNVQSQVTDTHILSSDGAIETKAFSTEYMKEFELEEL